MTATANELSYRIEQKRNINGTFPGPKSQALAERRSAVVRSLDAREAVDEVLRGR